MSKRVAMVMIVALAALLLAGGLTAAQSPSLPGKEPAAIHAVQAGTAAGRAYRLASGWQDWSVRGAASGGSYRIEVVGAVRGTGTPCCCSYLPCALKGYR